MGQSKLVIVEGIPGAGKTTCAQWVQVWLAGEGREVRLRLEGDLNHPADYESTACLAEAEYARLLAAFPAWRAVLEGLAERRGDEVFLSYRKPEGLPAELFAALARHEVYELPAADFQQVTLARWGEFAERAARGSFCYVFECCFLQNQTTTLLAVHDLDEETIAGQLLAIAERLRPLEALVIYLDTPDVRAGLERVAAERPREWLEYVSAYTTGQAWGRRQEVSGFDGMVKFYAARRALERKIFARLPLHGLWVEDAARDWAATYRQIAEFLEEHAG